MSIFSFVYSPAFYDLSFITTHIPFLIYTMKIPTNTLFTSFAFLFLLPLVSLLSDRCTPLKKCQPWVVKHHTFFSDPNGGQSTNTIPVSYFNSAWVAPGEMIWLDFKCDPGQVLVRENNGPGMELTASKLSNNRVRVKIPSKDRLGGPLSKWPHIDSVKLYFPEIPFEFRVKILPSDPLVIPVRPGDANADGKVNIMDMAPIAAGIYHHKHHDLPSIPNSTPVYTTPGVNWVKPWGNSWQWKGLVNEAIDYAHADCNADGTIDRSDFELMKTKLEPIDLSLFLKDFVNDLKFEVEPDPNKQAICFPALDGQNPKVEVPYLVTLDNPNNPPIGNILGIVHRRPLTQDGCSKVIAIKPGLDNGFVDATDNPLGYHEFWEEQDLYLEGLCSTDATTEVGVVDIGLFSTEKLHALADNDKIMDCIVDIDDIGRRACQGLCPVVQHDLEGFIFTMDANGQLDVLPTVCSRTELTLDPSQTCFSSPEIVIRDNPNDVGGEYGPFPPSPWTSPDIWIGNQNDPPEVSPGSSVEISVRGINLSCNSIESGFVQLYLVKQLDGINWNDPSNFELIGICDLGDIPSQGHSTCPITWNVPPTLTGDFSLVAVVSATGDDHQTLMESTSEPLSDIVTSYNHVAALMGHVN